MPRKRRPAGGIHPIHRHYDCRYSRSGNQEATMPAIGMSVRDISDMRGVGPVPVNSDWTTAANAKADIQAATGITFPADALLQDVFVTLWEGTSDPDDFAVLLCKATPAYTAPNGDTCAFASAHVPATGSRLS